MTLRAALLLLCLSGCGPAPEPLPPLVAGAASMLDDQRNFSYRSRLSASVQSLKEYEDALIQWSSLSTDVYGRAINPVSDIDTATLLLFPRHTPQQALAGLANDSIVQADIGLYMVCEPTNASCKLSKFGLLGSYPGIQNYFNQGRGSWLIILSKASAKGAVAFSFIEPSATSPATTASITGDSSALQMNVDLRSAGRLRARRDGDTRVDWSQLTRDGLGNEIAAHKLDKLTLARYQDQDLSRLERRLVDIEVLADQLWEAKLGGVASARLQALKERSTGAAFNGFSAPGLYLLALECTTCTNPAPKALTVVSVE